MRLTITNLLLLVTIIALAISLTMTLLTRDPYITLRDEDSYYSYKFRQQLLTASPRWPETQENPPLSARDAMHIADEICETLNTESKPLKIRNWGFDSITLTHLNFGYRDMRTKNTSTKWCYIVRCETLSSLNSQSFSQMRETASFMILMDGTVFVGENSWSNGSLEKRMRKHFAKINGQ